MSPVASKGPDFLVIGAQRAGTTWLHRVLRQHPSLWLPPVKELHYFDRLETRRTILDPKERRRVGLKRLLALDPWLIDYWLRARSDEWYARLFRDAQARGLIAGEITPAYATLNEQVLRRVQRMNNKIKLIFIMRDPVERAWSAVNNAGKKGLADLSTVEAAIEQARKSGTMARSAYVDTIERLEAVFPVKQIHYCFFDNLRDQPEALTTGLFLFLSPEAAPQTEIELPKAINVAVGSRGIPIEFAREMARDYLPMVQCLSRRFQGPPRDWCARYESLLGLGQMNAETGLARVLTSPYDSP